MRTATLIIGPKAKSGFHRITYAKARSVSDLLAIVDFTRCPPAARQLAMAEIDRRVGEASRYTEADYQQVRLSIGRKAP